VARDYSVPAATFDVNFLTELLLAGNGRLNEETLFTQALCNSVLPCCFEDSADDITALAVVFSECNSIVDMFSANQICYSGQLVRTKSLFSSFSLNSWIYNFFHSVWVKYLGSVLFFHMGKFSFQCLLLRVDLIRDYLNLRESLGRERSKGSELERCESRLEES